MKKFYKVAGITAAVLFVVGIAVALIAGSIQGRKTIEEVVNHVTDGKISVRLGPIKDFGINLGNAVGNMVDGVVDHFGEDGHYDLSDKIEVQFDRDYAIYEDQMAKTNLGSQVTNLRVSVGGALIQLVESEDENFYAEGKDFDKLQVFVKNGTLSLKTMRSGINGIQWKESRITLYIPKNTTFRDMEFELGAGKIELLPITTDHCAIEVGAGAVEGKGLKANDVSFEVGAGSIELKNSVVKNVEAEVGMGSFAYTGEITGDVSIECSMGGADLKLDGKAEDFNYKIECAMGGVTIDKQEYSGLAKEKTINNQATKNMELECSMGGINIRF